MYRPAATLRVETVCTVPDRNMQQRAFSRVYDIICNLRQNYPINETDNKANPPKTLHNPHHEPTTILLSTKQEAVS